MIFNNFSDAVSYLEGAGYVLIFLLMLIEGPIVTVAASFLASLGFFNIFVILILSFLGNFIGDYLHYQIGYYGGEKAVDKYLPKSGKSKKKILNIRKNVDNHFGKTILFIKLTPMASPGLIFLGYLKVPLRRFLLYSAIISLIFSMFFVAIGYYLGYAFDNWLKYFKITEYLFYFIIIVLICFMVYKKLKKD
ncbi:hypothetical protein COU57_04615 [Candidatus Pacearchaeota archaeon CG10_big_fil_rev_8_21_14_0_10_32_14]|nr:MAG: hypothetical protein COU57_04615 [Candidatus Pacearchaeota archaeon CG10_big_fil_rev_8_21_14_0_10_32_14]